LREFTEFDADTLKQGDQVNVSIFAQGDVVDVTGKSKGRGFQGVVKRHHFSGVGSTTHGASDRVRAPGSIGGSSYPSRVFKGMRMGGRMGFYPCNGQEFESCQGHTRVQYHYCPRFGARCDQRLS